MSSRLGKLFINTLTGMMTLGVLAASHAAAELTPLSVGAAAELVRVSYEPSEDSKLPKIDPRLFNGWSHVVSKLLRDGVGLERALQVYGTRRIPKFTPVYFGLNPKEKPSIYRGFSSKASRKNAKACFDRYQEYFRSAESQFKVPRTVLAAIMYVESHCGAVTGKEQVLYRLSRLASVGDPVNLDLNVTRHRKTSAKITRQQVEDRARYLEETFYPEILALIKVADVTGHDVHELRGSSAGAFGFTQFLPSNYIRFGVDADRDNRVSLFSPADAIWSTANMMAGHGWDITKPYQENRLPLWAYNRSEAYADAVIGLALALEK